MSGVAWPGTAPAGTAVLAVLEAPRPAVEAAMLTVRRARSRAYARASTGRASRWTSRTAARAGTGCAAGP